MKIDRRGFLAGISALSVAGVAGSKTVFGNEIPMKKSSVLRSKLPFGSTLDEQMEEIVADPLVLRFKEAREKLKKGPFYPKYHFIAPENNIGDPNGLCYWQGRWHLFYQFRPMEEPKMAHWGHAVSDDLLHWKDLPIALYPEPGKNHVSQCFSGSALVESDRVLAIYHATGKGNMVITSSDPLLLNWEKILRKPDKVTIPSHPKQDADGNPYRVWDPFLYKEGGTYYSISGVFMGNHQDKHKRKTVWHLFSSKNLLDWKYKGNLLENEEFTKLGDDGSCSYFWPLTNNKYLLIFFSHRNGSQHILGTYDKKRERFVAESHQIHNTGPSSATPDPENKGKIIVIQNKGGGRGSMIGNWNGIFTLPKKFSLGSNDIVNVEPAGDIASLRYDKKTVKNQKIEQGRDTLLEGIEGNAMEIEAVIGPGGSSMMEINVLRSPDSAEYTSVKFYRSGEPYNKHGGQRWTVSIDTSRSSLRPEVSHPFPVNTEFLRFNNEPLKIRLFIDMSIVEIFVNNQASLAQRVYPLKEESTGVSVRANAGGTVIETLNAWQMKSI